MIFFEGLLLFFAALAIFLIIFMLAYLVIRQRWRRKYAKWDHMIDLLLRKTIFFHEEDNGEQALIPVTARLKANLANKRFSSRLVNKMMAAKRNMSGQYGDNLRRLYLQLELDKRVLELLERNKWHLRAYAIQQIGTMGLKEHLTKVYRYTNAKNELVRVEAQIAVLNLFGFEGLRFLDVISYQLTEWQQIRLLKELSVVPQIELTGIEKWLASSNPSVIIFALKLARNYHRFELYDDIVRCLDHSDPNVRRQAVFTLTEIFTEDTSKVLLAKFEAETLSNRIAIMKAVKLIGDEQDVAALIGYLREDRPEIILAVARAIIKVSANGLDQLVKHPRAQVFPLKDMIPQLKSEQV